MSCELRVGVKQNSQKRSNSRIKEEDDVSISHPLDLLEFDHNENEIHC
jgi:hypothetical protein